MGQIGTWDASQLACNVGNIQIADGFGENAMFSVDVDDDDWAIHKGQGGSITRSKILTKVARVTVTQGQASILNDLLSAQRILDKATPGGAGLSSFGLKDLGGTTEITAAHAYIEGAPKKIDFKAEVSEREWVIVLMDASIYIGGNPPQ